MNTDVIQSTVALIAPTADIFRVYLPEIILSVSALLVLVVDAFCSRDKLNVGRLLAGLALFAAFAVAALHMSVLSMVLTGCSFLAVRLAGEVAGRSEFSKPITNCLILIATAASSVLFKQQDFLGIFVALETLTILLYALVGSCRGNALSLEAGVKYLIAGAVSGGMLLFGIMLLYGFTSLAGTPDPLSFYSICCAAAHDPFNPLAIVGAVLVIGGVMFKFGIFPMNLWIPDTYQGAPMHVTFLLATLSKAVGLFLMFVLLTGVFLPLFETLFPVLLVVSLVSMVHANAAALGQQNVKRLLGLSGASHASYLMLALLAVAKYRHSDSFDNVIFSMMALALALYMVFYVLSLYPIFRSMVRVPAHKGCEQELHIDDFAGMVSRSPVDAAALTSGIASLAGIPPTVGFIAKLALLWVLFYVEMYVPAIVMLVCVGASVYYYFAWVRKLFEKNDLPELEIAKPSFAGSFSLAFFAALTVVGCVIYFALFGLLR